MLLLIVCDAILKKVQTFTYLGSIITSDGQPDIENKRIIIAQFSIDIGPNIK